MAPRVDFLYQFDKGFFGKTLLSTAQIKSGKNIHPTKVISDSISDFNKYFESKFLNTLEKTPKTDAFEPLDNTTFSNVIF